MKRAFTLIELAIVLAIVLIIAACAIPACSRSHSDAGSSIIHYDMKQIVSQMGAPDCWILTERESGRCWLLTERGGIIAMGHTSSEPTEVTTPPLEKPRQSTRHE